MYVHFLSIKKMKKKVCFIVVDYHKLSDIKGLAHSKIENLYFLAPAQSNIMKTEWERERAWVRESKKEREREREGGTGTR